MKVYEPLYKPVWLANINADDATSIQQLNPRFYKSYQRHFKYVLVTDAIIEVTNSLKTRC